MPPNNRLQADGPLRGLPLNRSVGWTPMTERSRIVTTGDDLVSRIFELLDDNDAVEWENETAYQFMQAMAESLSVQLPDKPAPGAESAWQSIADALEAAAKPAAKPDTPESQYQYPPAEVLARYLAMLRDVLVDARARAYQHDPQVAELLDAVENVPDLLARWPDMNTAIVEGQLEEYERRYLEGGRRYTSTLRDGPRPGWQLKWGTPQT